MSQGHGLVDVGRTSRTAAVADGALRKQVSHTHNDLCGPSEPGGSVTSGLSGPAQFAEAGLRPQADRTALLLAYWSDPARGAGDTGRDSPGRELPYLDAIQRSFGRHDVGAICAHQDDHAAAVTAEVGAPALATGNHVAFAGAPSLHQAAHEAAHIVQQRRGVDLCDGGMGPVGNDYEQQANQVADLVVRGESCEALLGEPTSPRGPAQRSPVQRYEAGEHTKTGTTQEHHKKAYAPLHYTVLLNDTLAGIADKFQLSVAELRDANREKLKKWPAQHGGKRLIEGFAVGEDVAIPQKLNELSRAAIQHPSIPLTVNGVVLDYGTVIAMGGDLFASPEQLASTSPDELREIAALIEEEKKTGKAVSTERWQEATSRRYGELAAKNEAHYAPSNPDLLAVSGKSTGDHKQSWEDNHHKALAAARAGDKDKALLINAFGDHFLTDAFAAGHLFNKRDLMEKFNAQLPTTGRAEQRQFTDTSKAFFDRIAQMAFTGKVATAFSQYETTERYFGIRPNIDSVWMFSRLLQAIHLEQPDLLESAIVKGTHDKLNELPGDLPVHNALGDTWSLSGANTLNAETLAVARRAVAQSQQNLFAAFRADHEPDYPTLFKHVWDFTPQPTEESRKKITNQLNSGSDVNNSELQLALAALIAKEYSPIIDDLVARKKLRIA